MMINVSVPYGGPSFNRPSIYRRPDSHTCFFLFVIFVSLEDVAFSEFFSVPLPFSLCNNVWRVRHTLIPSDWCFSTL